MKIEIESTGQLTEMDGVPVRVWDGVTATGIRCKVFVHRLAVGCDQDSTEFDRELEERLEPGRVVPLRRVL